MKIGFSGVILGILLGCGLSKSQNAIDLGGQHEVKLENAPTKQELLRALGRGYTSAPGFHHECIGRLIFDVDGAIQWPTSVGEDSSDVFSSVFSEDIFDQGDGVAVQDVRIAVVGPKSLSTTKRILDRIPWESINQYRDLIVESVAYLKKTTS